MKADHGVGTTLDGPDLNGRGMLPLLRLPDQAQIHFWIHDTNNSSCPTRSGIGSPFCKLQRAGFV